MEMSLTDLYLKRFVPENCCGSRVEFVETLPTSPFHRQTVGTGFYIKQGISPRTDIAAPSRILDFRVSRIINDSLYVELEWSAPGGDFDKGKGTAVQLLHGRSHSKMSQG